jgi:hypothetical protein
MAVLDDVKELLAQYAGGSAPAGDVGAHFQQVSQSVDSGALAQGIAGALRSDKTPPFAQLVSQLFTSGSGAQKNAMLDTLLSALSPEQREQASALIPELAGVIGQTGTPSAANVSPDAVQKLAKHAEQQNRNIVDKMSALYAEHPALVKTLGSTAMMIAMRTIAERRSKA